MTDEPSTRLELTAFCVRGEPISYAEAIRGNFAPIKAGDRWGPPWSTTWFHIRGRVPESWAGRRVVATFDLGFTYPVTRDIQLDAGVNIGLTDAADNVNPFIGLSLRY